jgi:hypothetical protein
MKVGILAGGFKPFTAGHFTELSFAVSENDVVFLFYGIAERKKGSDYVYTKEMSEKIYDIMSRAGGPLERAFGSKLFIVRAVPTPINYTFSAIGQMVGKPAGAFDFNNYGINPSSVDEITIYGDREDAEKYLVYLKDPVKSEKYFGNLARDASQGGFAAFSDGEKVLRFDTGYGDTGDLDARSLIALSRYLPSAGESELRRRGSVRGTQTRQAILMKDKEKIAEYLPPGLTNSELEEIYSILISSITEMRIRMLVRSLITEAAAPADPLRRLIRSMLQEGGAAGHLMHLYEDEDLTFREMKDVINQASEGKLESVTEKLDGLNLVFTYSIPDGTIMVARSGGDITRGGMDASQLASKFAGRGNLEKAFSSAYEVLEQSVSGLTPEEQTELFGESGNFWYSIEVIYSQNPNVVQYDSNSIVFHQSPVFESSNGRVKNMGADERSVLLSQKIDSMRGALNKESWQIHGPAVVAMRQMSDGTAAAAAISKLNEALTSVGLSDDSTIREYTYKFVLKEIRNYGISDESSEDVAKRVVKDPGYLDLRALQKKYPNESEKIRDAVKGESQILKKAMEPLDSAVGNFAVKLLETVESSFVSDNPAEVSRLQSATRAAIDSIRGSGDPAAIEFLDRQLKRLGGTENIRSAVEGIVFIRNGKAYKFTGSFAAANQILGFLKFKR